MSPLCFLTEQNVNQNNAFLKDQLKNAAQQALTAIQSTRTPTASDDLAARGQHVFNNGILKFHRNVLEDLVGNEQVDNLVKDSIIPLGQTEKTAISEMVVHFSSEDGYVDYNAGVYGEYARMLREAFVAYLKACTSKNNNAREGIQKMRKKVQFIADELVNRDVYVDPMARDRWLHENQNHVEKYNRVRDALKNMFKNILQDFRKVSEKIRCIPE
ncbi:hypothetical protein ABG768_003089 [Culter alburnus]|uniref:Uncharacterized protein n=1 Tax=Culter alburnus TaxID=194366 RepID=A0AAW2A579_CULAL